MDKIYTPEELAKAWKVSVMTIYKLLWQNKLPHFKVGRSIRIPQDHLETYMKRAGNLRHFTIKSSPVVPASVKEFLRLVEDAPKSKRDNVVEIRLFGSYARGDYNENSDIDMLMILKEVDSKVSRWVASLNDRAMATVGYEDLLAVLRMSEDHWQRHRKMESPLFHSISREGVVLWTNTKS